MTSEQTLYPQVPPPSDPSLYPPQSIVKSASETVEFIEARLSPSRVDEMVRARAVLEKQLGHYRKIQRHWTRGDSVLKIAGTVLTVSTTIGATVVPFVGPVIAAGVLGGCSALSVALTETVVIGLTSRKKKVFRERCQLVQSYLDRMFVYIEKCRSDNVISIQELEGFRNLMEDYNNELNKTKASAVVDKRLEKIANRAAETQIKKEYVHRLKERKLQELRSTLT